MVKATVEYVNGKLAALNYVEKSFGLCESVVKGDKQFPAEYHSKGEYKPIDLDKWNGVSYIRKDGDISIADEENTLQACATLSRVTIPLKLVVAIPRKKLDCDDNYSEDVIAQTIMRTLITKDPALKVSLSARQATIQVTSYNTNSISVLSGEYTRYPKKDINYKMVYLSLDLSVVALVTHDCLTQDCYGTYS